jgi:hypothetical protein
MRQARSVLRSASINPAVLMDAQSVGAVMATVVISRSAPSQWSACPIWAVVDSARKFSYRTLPGRCPAA